MSAGPEVDEERAARALAAAQAALRGVTALLPHLAGLAHLVRLSADWRAGTAGVFPSGRIAVNPDWFLELLPAERVFVCPCHQGVFDAQGVATAGPPAAAGQSLETVPLEVDANAGTVFLREA